MAGLDQAWHFVNGNECQMTKLKFQMKFKFQSSNIECFDIGPFVIDLTFACLPVGRDFDI